MIIFLTHLHQPPSHRTAQPRAFAKQLPVFDIRIITFTFKNQQTCSRMYNIKRVLVGLDFSDLDNTVVRYGAFICEITKSEELIFVHVEENEGGENPDLYRNYEGEPEDRLKETVETAIGRQMPDNWRVQLLKGSASSAFLDYAKDQNADMIIVGEKHPERGHGSITRRIARHAPCSVFFVPENPKFKLNRILLPVDFSDYSKLAFEEVRFFDEYLKSEKIYGLHVYYVPSGYYKSGKSYEEFAEIMKENAKKDFQQFIHQHQLQDVKVEMHYRLDGDQKPADVIDAFSREMEIDLILMGARGHSRTSALLLGSKAEDFLDRNHTTPLMILKKKGETLNLLQTILNI